MCQDITFFTLLLYCNPSLKEKKEKVVSTCTFKEKVK